MDTKNPTYGLDRQKFQNISVIHKLKSPIVQTLQLKVLDYIEIVLKTII